LLISDFRLDPNPVILHPFSIFSTMQIYIFMQIMNELRVRGVERAHAFSLAC